VPQIRLWKPPVEEADLVDAALAEIGRGATWVKVIADSPTWPLGPTHGVLPQHVALEHWARIEGRHGVLIGGYDRLVRFSGGYRAEDAVDHADTIRGRELVNTNPSPARTLRMASPGRPAEVLSGDGGEAQRDPPV
jgi:hypothetical protein